MARVGYLILIMLMIIFSMTGLFIQQTNYKTINRTNNQNEKLEIKKNTTF